MNEARIISVVIPTYNRAPWVAAAVQSALAQTYPHTEVIVVDDGSTDSTADVLEAFTRDGRVRYFHQENLGVSAARNRGIREARGRFIAFLDSDDVWYPWKLEVQSRLLETMPRLALVCTEFAASTAEGDDAAYSRSHFKVFRRQGVGYADVFDERARLADLVGVVPGVPGDTLVHWGEVFEWLFQGNFIHTPTVLCRREAILEAGGFDESLRTQEDFDLYLRITHLHPIAFIDLASALYATDSNDRLSGNENILAIRENVYRTLVRVLAETPALVRTRPALVHRRLGAVSYDLGKALLAAGQKRRARAMLLESLRHRPTDVRAGALLALGSLPGNGIALYRRWRARSANGRAGSKQDQD